METAFVMIVLTQMFTFFALLAIGCAITRISNTLERWRQDDV